MNLKHNRITYGVSAACFRAALIHAKLIQLERRFDPNQPRVPAGHPDGGQWTDDPRFGGGVGYRDRLLQRVQLQSRYNVGSLILHEGRGGAHTISLHVGKSDAFLLRRINTPINTTRFGSRYYSSVSTFRNLREANGFVNATLFANSTTVDAVSSGARQDAIIEHQFRRSTGFGYVSRRIRFPFAAKRGTPRKTEMTSVRVLIIHDPSMKYGYRVQTAFPIR